jgi:ribonuclease HI
MNTSKPHVTIYTDGGCEPNPGVGGWAALLIFDDRQQELSGGDRDSTNNRMELTAVMSALESLPGPHQIDLYTDSQYVKQGITQWIKNWIKKDWRDVKNPDLWQQLHAATQRHTIQWHWVKDHAGYEHNERVDQLAMAEIAKLTGRAVSPVKAAAPAQPVDAASRLYIGANYSYDDKSGGWGVVIVNGSNQQELSGRERNSSENQLLLIAAAAALEILPAPTTIAVHTASEYLQKGMSQWIKGWIKKGWRTASGEPVKNRELWERLQVAAERHSVQWLYQDKSVNAYTRRAHELAQMILNK